MKSKVLILLAALSFAAVATAQEARTMYIFKNGALVEYYAVSDIDSIKFSAPSIEIDDPDGVMINGVKWATRNVGEPGTFVDNPEDPGMLYQWNSNVGWSSSDPRVSFPSGKTWNNNWNGSSATTWQTTNNVCPAGWRIPTYEEFQNLVSDTKTEWTTVNGQNGRKIVYYSLFFPAAGYRQYTDGTLKDAGASGLYWSSNTYNNDGTTHYVFGGGVHYGASCIHCVRANGYSVRCVADE